MFSADKYYEYADITRGEAGFTDVSPTEGWLFFRVELFGDSTVSDSLDRSAEFAASTYYSVRLANNSSSNNAKSGLLLRNQRTSSITTAWTTSDMKVFADVNGDVSGTGGVNVPKPDGAVTGYEVDHGNSGSWLWARRLNQSFTGPGGTVTRPSIEFAFNYKAYNLAKTKNFLPSNLTYLELDSTKGLQDNQNYLWNDKYTLAEAGSPNPGEIAGGTGLENIYQLDTLRLGGFPQPGTKSGIKYEDDNADGDQDAGEDPLSGWVIRAYSDTNGDGVLQAGETTIADSDTTTATGAYELQLNPGNYVVCEVLQANWFQREPVEANNRCAAIAGLGPDGYALAMTSGASHTGNDFGNFRQGTKSGIKYEDDNADGNQDAGEDPLSGWVIRAYSDTNGDGILQAGETTIADSDTTTATGAYAAAARPRQVRGLRGPARRTGSSASPSRRTTAAPRSRASAPDGYAITITSGSTETGNDFGNFRQGTKSGIKYEDDNADGNQDAGEDPLSGWVIRAYSDTNGDGMLQAGETTIADSDTTTATGAYAAPARPRQLRGLRGPARRTGSSASPSRRTTAAPRSRASARTATRSRSPPARPRPGTTSATSARAPSPASSIEDDNADGNQDAGEDPLSGWVIRAYSDTNGDGTLQAGETTIADSDTTTATGAYELQLDPGKYVVCEVLQAAGPSASPSPRTTAAPRSRASAPDGYAIDRHLGLHRDRQRLRQLPPGHQVRHQVRGRQRRRQPGRRRGPALRLGHPRLLGHQRRRRAPGRRDHHRRLRHHHRHGRLRAPARPRQVRGLRGPPGGWSQREPVAANDRCAAISGLGAGRLRDHVTSGFDRDRATTSATSARAPSRASSTRTTTPTANQDAGEDPLSGWVIRAYVDDQRRRHPPGRRDHDRRLRHDHRHAAPTSSSSTPASTWSARSSRRTGSSASPSRRTTAAPPSPASAPTATPSTSPPASSETGNDFGNFRQGTKSGIKYEDDNADGNQDAGEDPPLRLGHPRLRRRQRRRHPPGRRDDDRRLRHDRPRPAPTSSSSTPASTSSARSAGELDPARAGRRRTTAARRSQASVRTAMRST